MAKQSMKWVLPCERCIRESRNDIRLNRLPLENPSNHITGPEVAMETDFVPEIPLSGGYNNIAIAVDWLSRY